MLDEIPSTELEDLLFFLLLQLSPPALLGQDLAGPKDKHLLLNLTIFVFRRSCRLTVLRDIVDIRYVPVGALSRINIITDSLEAEFSLFCPLIECQSFSIVFCVLDLISDI